MGESINVTAEKSISINRTDDFQYSSNAFLKLRKLVESNGPVASSMDSNSFVCDNEYMGELLGVLITDLVRLSVTKSS